MGGQVGVGVQGVVEQLGDGFRRGRFRGFPVGFFVGFTAFAQHNEVAHRPGQGHVEQVDAVEVELAAFQFVVIGKDGFQQTIRVGGRHQVELVVGWSVGLTPELCFSFFLGIKAPVAEGQEHGMEFQSFGFMDGQDAQAIDTGARWYADLVQGFIPIGEEAG
ncbi:MAG: hypothetical protein BWY72_02278 [Bacteroidetes bacterium ADurb.Bin416]|nr:MAG: hypothetical protein BWY72_02278 [Bacteroidetes bacterium ADurb.Bin416]